MKNVSRRSFLQNFSMGMGAGAIVPLLSSFNDIPKVNSEIYTGKKLNIALCGLGRYANILADGFEASQYCQVSGIVTGTPAKAQEWGKRFNIPQRIFTTTRILMRWSAIKILM